MWAQELPNAYVMDRAGGAGAAPNIPLLHHVLPDDVHAPEDDDLSADYPGAYPGARMRAGAALPEAGSRVANIRAQEVGVRVAGMERGARSTADSSPGFFVCLAERCCAAFKAALFENLACIRAQIRSLRGQSNLEVSTFNTAGDPDAVARQQVGSGKGEGEGPQIVVLWASDDDHVSRPIAEALQVRPQWCCGALFRAWVAVSRRSGGYRGQG